MWYFDCVASRLSFVAFRSMRSHPSKFFVRQAAKHPKQLQWACHSMRRTMKGQRCRQPTDKATKRQAPPSRSSHAAFCGWVCFKRQPQGKPSSLGVRIFLKKAHQLVLRARPGRLQAATPRALGGYRLSALRQRYGVSVFEGGF